LVCLPPSLRGDGAKRRLRLSLRTQEIPSLRSEQV